MAHGKLSLATLILVPQAYKVDLEKLLGNSGRRTSEDIKTSVNQFEINNFNNQS